MADARSTDDRIFLSPPDVGAAERELLLDAFDSNWIAPVGAHLDAFEREAAAVCGVPSAAALSSGTAALHLALLLLGVGPGDAVVVPTLTFVASANAVGYVGAEPVFVDVEARSWCLDPDLLAEELTERARAGRPVKAVISVDLYGQCADYTRLEPVCREHGALLIEDAAEAIGASWAGRPAGSFGAAAALSFNGNKLLTTSGGGMLLSADDELVRHARKLATQAREDVVHYEHVEVGFNYRLSNLLAALGRGQLQGLDAKLAARADVNRRYREAFAAVEGIGFLPDAHGGEPNHWLTVVTVDPERCGTDHLALMAALDARSIEARPAWKPMHQQPLYRDAACRGGAVADRIFATGLCLPSGSSLRRDQQERVIEIVLAALGT